MAVSVAACGGDSAGDGPDPTSAPETPETTTETTEGTTGTTETTGSTEPEVTSSTAGEPAATGSGTATLTIGDLTAEFSGLTCYYDEDAAEANNDDDTTFGAVVQDGDAGLAVVIRDMGIELFEVLYITGDGDQWHMNHTDTENHFDHVYSVENGVITVENGEFDQIVDQAETGVSEMGSLQASCG